MTAFGFLRQSYNWAMVAARMASAPPKLWPVKTTVQSSGTAPNKPNHEPTSHFFTCGSTRFSDFMKPLCTMLEPKSPPNSRLSRVKSASTFQFFMEVICVPRKTTMASLLSSDFRTRAWMLSLWSLSICSSQSPTLGHKSDSPPLGESLISAVKRWLFSADTEALSPNILATEDFISSNSALLGLAWLYTASEAAQAAPASGAAGCCVGVMCPEDLKQDSQFTNSLHSGNWYGQPSVS
mmetsp:Transcript_34147/g.99119  ORF Transcript_34147/g.99119 Transcript_34147/m.99119 type:complete len:238 (+) Transcript_34147:494-1207(+)